MSISDKTIRQLEKATRKQSENELWCQIHIGRLPASNHYNIYTKMNSVLKSVDPIKSKTTLLAAQIMFGGSDLKTQATTWAIQNEQVALKIFYSQKQPKHNNLKIQNCAIFLHKRFPYIAVSPDGINNY